MVLMSRVYAKFCMPSNEKAFRRKGSRRGGPSPRSAFTLRNAGQGNLSRRSREPYPYVT